MSMPVEICVGMAPESGEIVISNILIQNNVMIGTRMGIYFFTLGNGGAYDKIRILHNTPNNTPSFFEMKNNFFYVNGTIEFFPKNSWHIGYNYYYNTYYVPSMIYFDSTSKSSQIEKSRIFQIISYLYKA